MMDSVQEQQQPSSQKASSVQATNYTIQHKLIGASNNSQVYELFQRDHTSGETLPLNEVCKVVRHTNAGTAKEAHSRECAHLYNEFHVLRALAERSPENAKQLFIGVRGFVKANGSCGLRLDRAQCDLLQFIDHCPLEIGSESYFQAVRLSMKQVVRALAYLHSEGFAHNDVKLPNIFLFVADAQDDCLIQVQQNVALSAKLADFGFAAAVTNSETQAQNCDAQFVRWRSRTLRTLAPEILTQLQAFATATLNKDDMPQWKVFDEQRADVFAAGISLFEAMTRVSCFAGACASREDSRFAPLYDAAKKVAFWRQPEIMAVLPYLKACKEARLGQFMDLVTKMLEVDPERRITAQECLKHPFFA